MKLRSKNDEEKAKPKNNAIHKCKMSSNVDINEKIEMAKHNQFKILPSKF